MSNALTTGALSKQGNELAERDPAALGKLFAALRSGEMEPEQAEQTKELLFAPYIIPKLKDREFADHVYSLFQPEPGLDPQTKARAMGQVGATLAGQKQEFFEPPERGPRFQKTEPEAKKPKGVLEKVSDFFVGTAEASEPWQQWDEEEYQLALENREEFRQTNDPQLAKAEDWISKWEKAHQGGDRERVLGQVGQTLAGQAREFRPDKPQAMEPAEEPVEIVPDDTPLPGEPAFITEHRRRKRAAEAEAKPKGPPIDNNLETLSKINDANHARPSEFSNRENANYSLMDLVPMVMGGNAEAWHEPTLDEFRTAARAEYGDRVNSMDENSMEYRKYADQQWVEAYDAAKAGGRPIFRQSMAQRRLRGTGTWGDLPTNVFSEAVRDPLGTARTVAEEAIDLSTGAADAFAETAMVGIPQAITRAFAPERAAETKKRANRSVLGSGLGAIGGIFSPMSLPNLAASTTYKVGKAIPKLAAGTEAGGLARTLSAGAAGGAGAATDVVGRRAVNAATGGPQPADDPVLQILLGMGGGAALHGTGEGINAVRQARRGIPRDPRQVVGEEGRVFREADRYDVTPTLTGPPRAPPKLAELTRRSGGIDEAIELQSERLLPQIKAAGLQEEMANQGTRAAVELEEYFVSPEGLKRVSAAPVLRVADTLLDRMVNRQTGQLFAGANEADVNNLRKFVSRLRSSEGPVSMNAREVHDELQGLREKFHLLPGEKASLSAGGKNIVKELERALLGVRDQFKGAPLDPLAYRVGRPGQREHPGGELRLEKEVTGLSALEHERAQEHDALQRLKSRAGLPEEELRAGARPVREKGPWQPNMTEDEDVRLLQTISSYGKPGATRRRRDQALEALARIGGPEAKSDLDSLRGLLAVKNLDAYLRGGQTPIYAQGEGLGLGSVGTLQRFAGRTDPQQKTLAEEIMLSGLGRVITAMRKGEPQALAAPFLPHQAFALRGGTAGTRAEMLMTNEDIGNLKKLLELHGGERQ